MSQRSEQNLDNALAHVRKHAAVCQARIRREVQDALDAFERDTGCSISSIDVKLIRYTEVGRPWVTHKVGNVYLAVTRKGVELNDI